MRAIPMPESGRLVRIDALRGLAVVLMVLDHQLAVMPSSPGYWLRMTITRAALPLFAFCTGYLLARRGELPSRARMLEYVGVGLLGTLVFWRAGLPLPDPLLAFALLTPLFGLLMKYPVEVGAIGIVQAFTWPLVGWTYYQPGMVLALIVLGYLAPARLQLDDPYAAPEAVWLGRHALGLYMLHLPVLLLVAAAAQS